MYKLMLYKSTFYYEYCIRHRMLHKINISQITYAMLSINIYFIYYQVLCKPLRYNKEGIQFYLEIAVTRPGSATSHLPKM